MKIRFHARALACGVALGGLALSGAVAAEKKEKDKESVKIRTGNRPVIVDLDGLEALADLDLQLDDISVLSDPVIKIGEEIKVVYVDGEDGKPRLVTVPETDMLRKRGYLGISLTGITEELRQHFGAPEDAGILIARVEEDSPAAKAGVKVGDVITRVGDVGIDSPGDVSRALRELDKGDEVELEVVRDGRTLKLEAEVGETNRMVYDLGWLQEQFGGKGPNTFRYHLDTDAIEESVERFKRAFEDGDLQERLRRIPTINQQIEQRMKELEERLRELEDDIEEDE